MTETITLNTNETILAAVPQFLGFTPRNAVVVLGLGEDRRSLRVTMQADLGRQDPETIIQSFLPGLEKAKARHALLVVYGDVAPDGHPLPHPEFADRLVDFLPLRGAFYVHDGRFWSYGCDDPDCRPSGGGVVATESVMAVHNAARGRRVYGSREEMAEIVAPAPLADRTMRQLGIDALTGTSRLRYLLDPPDVDYMLGLWAATVATVHEGGQPSAEDLALLTLGMSVIPLRDAIIATTFDRMPREALPLLERLTREAPAEYVASTAVMLAWHAFAAHEGVVAHLAADRVLEADPEHALARIIRYSLDKGVPPSALRQIAETTRTRMGL